MFKLEIPDINIFRISYSTSRENVSFTNKEKCNLLIIQFFKLFILEIKLPEFIKSYKVISDDKAYGDNTTIYYNREFGIIYNPLLNMLFLKYGIQTDLKSKIYSKLKSWILPWNELILVTQKVYDNLDNVYYVKEYDNNDRKVMVNYLREFSERLEHCPSVDFLLRDHDSKLIVAKTLIVESTYKRGTGYFKWLNNITKNKVFKYLFVNFSDPIGYDKDGYESGTTAITLELEKYKTRAETLRLFCARESINQKSKILFLTQMLENETPEEAYKSFVSMN